MSQPADADFRPASGLLAQLDLLRIEVAGPVLRLAQPPSLGPLIADLESAGARVVRITAQPTSLESVFLTLTGHALRDA